MNSIAIMRYQYKSQYICTNVVETVITIGEGDVVYVYYSNFMNLWLQMLRGIICGIDSF